MKIKGVYNANKVIGTRRVKKGDPIEFEPQEKPPIAVREAVATRAPNGFSRWADTITVGSLQFTPNGLSSKGFQSNAYLADGSCTIHEVDQATDKYFRRGVKQFHIEFEDCLDGMGQPELRITDFTLSE